MVGRFLFADFFGAGEVHDVTTVASPRHSGVSCIALEYERQMHFIPQAGLVLHHRYLQTKQ